VRKRSILLGGLALVLVLGLTIGSSLAYFTTFTRATGTVPIEMGFTTTIEEPIVDTSTTDFVKTVVISNEGPNEVYVRARAFAGDNYPLSYSGEGWTDGGDGYWYYSALIPADGESLPLFVTISGVPAEPEEGQTFNVVVVYESAMVTYDAEGNPEVADWSREAVVSETLEGGQP